MSVLIILFLTAFVLVGIYPAMKRTVAEMRKQLRSAAQSKEPMGALLKNLHAELFAKPPVDGQLNDFEIIVLRRLAQARGRALSRKQVNAPLLFGEETLHKTLRSLNHRGLVQMKLTPLLGQRFALSEAGRRYALEQGYLIQTRKG
jgi:uncharacterized protein YneF (UPF0154 family)